MKIESDTVTGEVSLVFDSEEDLHSHMHNLINMASHNKQHDAGEYPHLTYIIQGDGQKEGER